MQLVGKILWWNGRDGFGVIEDAGGREFYFDASVITLKPKQQVKRGSVVTFQQNPNISDRLCAHKVRVPLAADRKKIEVKYDRALAKAAEL